MFTKIILTKKNVNSCLQKWYQFHEILTKKLIFKLFDLIEWRKKLNNLSNCN